MATQGTGAHVTYDTQQNCVWKKNGKRKRRQEEEGERERNWRKAEKRGQRTKKSSDNEKYRANVCVPIGMRMLRYKILMEMIFILYNM